MPIEPPASRWDLSVDMLPDENGNLSPFCIDQLVDVIRSLQRCLDLEVIHAAWSHSLDHSPATSSHIFQMKTVLSQLHGAHCSQTFVVDTPRAKTARRYDRQRTDQRLAVQLVACAG